jgi:hypothetical protein
MNLDSQNNYNIKTQKTGLINKIFKTIFTRDKVAEVTVEDSNDIKDLVESIKNARKDWMCANSNFNYANDQESIDYYTYMIKAYQVRYDYLIKKAKEKGIKSVCPELADIVTYGGETAN